MSGHPVQKRLTRALFVVCLLSGLALMGGACRSVFATPTPTPTFIPPSPTPTLTIAERNPTVWNAWSFGPHAAGYDLGKGPNTYCARCHSPANWDPQAVIDPAPNCVSCKFPFEETVRIASGNPLIVEADWQGIRCATCHRMEGAIPTTELTWYDARTGYNETVSSSTQLCEQCHTDTASLRYDVGMDGSTHPGFACTSCHDPHTANATCGASGCHSDVVALLVAYSPLHQGVTTNDQCLVCHPGGMAVHSMEVQHKNITDCVGCHQDVIQPPAAPESVTGGHALYHKNIACVACHDAAGLDVQYIEQEDRYMTFRTTVIESLGRPVTAEYTSHNLKRSVDCGRCHYAGNPLGVKETVTAGMP